jgi:predicted anti-sigma-YlaC factor YlaD
MNHPDCGAMRDLLPAYVRGRLAAPDVAAAELHLAECADCRQEEQLLHLLSAPLPATPAGLEDAVLAAVQRRAAPRGVRVGRLAMAAATAAALLGGAMALETLFPGGDPVQPVATAALDEADAPVSWAVALDPLLHGGSGFEHMSVEELELVLAELDR